METQNEKMVRVTNAWLTDCGPEAQRTRLERYNRLSVLDWKASEGTLTGPERIERDIIGCMVPPEARGF